MSYSEINISFDDGECDGFNTNFLKEPNLRNFLEKNFPEDEVNEILLFLQNDCKSTGLITIMTHLSVDEDRRGKGVGTELVNEFLELADSPIVILIADETNDQNKGFSLETFYEGFGFEKTKFYSKGVGSLFVLF